RFPAPMSESSLAVVLSVPKEPPAVVGFPAAVRTAHGLALQDRIGPILLVAAPNGFAQKWKNALGRGEIRCVTEEELRGAVASNSPLLVVAPDGFPVGGGLQRFLQAAERLGAPAAWVRQGRALAAYLPDTARFGGASAPGTLLASVLADEKVRRIEAGTG